jgi:hypothetical protein
VIRPLCPVIREIRKATARNGCPTAECPHPRVFFVRVANKGLMLDAASTLAETGLEVLVFSAGCKLDALAARSELRKNKRRVGCSEEKVGSRLGWEPGVTSCKTLRVRGGDPPPGFL